MRTHVLSVINFKHFQFLPFAKFDFALTPLGNSDVQLPISREIEIFRNSAFNKLVRLFLTLKYSALSVFLQSLVFEVRGRCSGLKNE